MMIVELHSVINIERSYMVARKMSEITGALCKSGNPYLAVFFSRWSNNIIIELIDAIHMQGLWGWGLGVGRGG